MQVGCAASLGSGGDHIQLDEVPRIVIGSGSEGGALVTKKWTLVGMLTGILGLGVLTIVRFAVIDYGERRSSAT